MNISTKPWRTLIRVVAIDNGNKCFYVVIPAFDQRQIIRVKYNCVPEVIQKRLIIGARFHAQVNIGADHPQDIRFDQWEAE